MPITAKIKPSNSTIIRLQRVFFLQTYGTSIFKTRIIMIKDYYRGNHVYCICIIVSLNVEV